MFEPITVIRNKSFGSWSVCLQHLESKRRYWLDVSYQPEYKDVDIDWNQYIFYLTDSNDVERKEFQENCDNFDEASSEVVSALEKVGELCQNYSGDWFAVIGEAQWRAETIPVNN